MSDTETKKRAADDENGENGVKKQKTDDECGLLIVGGGVNWDLIGRKELPKGAKQPPKEVNLQNLWGPHIWKENIRIRAIATSCTSNHSVIITEDFKAYSWGRNDAGQLGHGDTQTRYKPTLIEELDNHKIVSAATGRSHTLFLTDKGAVYSVGANKSAQLGQGNDGKDVTTPAKIDYDGKPIVKMACGAEFSMILDSSGNLFSFGNPEYGQIGHNTDGKMLEKAGKVTFLLEKSPRMISRYVEKPNAKQPATTVTGVSIVDVKCGTNHCVALDTRGRVFTWGFAGYGRLGHSDTKDELVPRQVKQLENLRAVVTKIAAGSTFCLATATNKNLYFWGQTKSSGEATMYPKPVQDLCGWNIKNISCCNKSIAVVADDSVITWGPSPTYGELLYGEGREKSSTQAKEVKPLEGVCINDVACGFGHILMIARDVDEEEKNRLAKLPRW